MIAVVGTKMEWIERMKRPNALAMVDGVCRACPLLCALTTITCKQNHHTTKKNVQLRFIIQ
jgi:hypothetical protein